MTDQTSPFSDKLANLLAVELPLARRDPERISEMIERIASGLGLTIAVAAGGDPQRIDTMIEGATAYAHSEAVDRSKLARVLTGDRP